MRSRKNPSRPERTIWGFKEGDKVQYNQKYDPKEVVTILKILDNHALIKFPSGTLLATTLSGLWPLKRKIN